MRRYSWDVDFSEEEKETLVDSVMDDPIFCRNFLLLNLTRQQFNELEWNLAESDSEYHE